MGNENACWVCWRNPMKANGCGVAVVYIDMERYARIPFYREKGERCSDCNALSGHYHHWGCDAEIYPVCGGQMIGCDCLDIECSVMKSEHPRRRQQFIHHGQQKNKRAGVQPSDEPGNCTPAFVCIMVLKDDVCKD